MVTEVGLQGSLFDGGEPAVDHGFAGLRRIALDERSWVDHAPGWLRGSDELFALLHRTGRFSQRTVQVWDRTVPEPRLTAGWSTEVAGDDVPAPLRELATACPGTTTSPSTGSGSTSTATGGTAWPGTATGTGTPIATRWSPRSRSAPGGGSGSGRSAAGRPSSCDPGHGDLVVMGGACQHEWEHTVPKEAAPAGPRMSITLRHSAQLG